MSKKITQLPEKTSIETGDLFVIVDVDDGGNKKVNESNVKTSLLGGFTFTGNDAAAPGDITITRAGETKVTIGDAVMSFGDLLQLQVPKGFNASTPGIVPTAYEDDIVGLDWYGTAAVDSKLRIAGRIECKTGESKVMPASDDTVDLGSMALKYKSIYATDIASPHFIRKAADETVTNSDTLQDDNHLTTSLEAGGIYHFRFILRFSIGDDFVGVKLALGGSLTVTHLLCNVEIADLGGGAIAVPGFIDTFGDGGALTHTSISAGDSWVRIEGTIKVNAAGTFKLRWAQGAVNALDNVLTEGSLLTIVRLN